MAVLLKSTHHFFFFSKEIEKQFFHQASSLKKKSMITHLRSRFFREAWKKSLFYGLEGQVLYSFLVKNKTFLPKNPNRTCTPKSVKTMTPAPSVASVCRTFDSNISAALRCNPFDGSRRTLPLRGTVKDKFIRLWRHWLSANEELSSLRVEHRTDAKATSNTPPLT